MSFENRVQSFGILGMGGAILFFLALLFEYHHGLFPPGSGALTIANQIVFSVGMTAIMLLLWGRNWLGRGKTAVPS